MVHAIRDVQWGTPVVATVPRDRKSWSRLDFARSRMAVFYTKLQHNEPQSFLSFSCAKPQRSSRFPAKLSLAFLEFVFLVHARYQVYVIPGRFRVLLHGIPGIRGIPGIHTPYETPDIYRRHASYISYIIYIKYVFLLL